MRMGGTMPEDLPMSKRTVKELENEMVSVC